jgi:16S rRNA A1518/A1519 N6-dimethyltransferase RsmA/KsgA/DIM1 with predicted DNA glycosylase/AP lyase activity
VRPLQRTDFAPVPDVDTVLVRIAQRKAPLIEREDARVYREFVEYGFTRWKRHLRAAYKNIFTYKQWKGLSRELGFSPISTPSQLNVEQWVGLFDRYRGRRENHPVHRATKGIHPPS